LSGTVSARLAQTRAAKNYRRKIALQRKCHHQPRPLRNDTPTCRIFSGRRFTRRILRSTSNNCARFGTPEPKIREIIYGAWNPFTVRSAGIASAGEKPDDTKFWEHRNHFYIPLPTDEGAAGAVACVAQGGQALLKSLLGDDVNEQLAKDPAMTGRKIFAFIPKELREKGRTLTNR